MKVWGLTASARGTGTAFGLERQSREGKWKEEREEGRDGAVRFGASTLSMQLGPNEQVELYTAAKCVYNNDAKSKLTASEAFNLGFVLAVKSPVPIRHK